MTNINLKDGQEVPKTIHYRAGRFRTWEFMDFVSDGMESLYKKRKFTKTRIYFSDGSRNYMLDIIAEREGKKVPKDDHWVNVYGYTIMPIVWKPSGKVKFATYGAQDTTLYKFAKKNYPQAKWMERKGVPKWVREK